MKTLALWTAFILLCEIALASGKIGFSRYQIIVSRQPFVEPPAETITPSNSPPPVAFIKDIELNLITQYPGIGTRVGFKDKTTHKTYFLGVGATEDGIRVADVDFRNKAVLLQKNAESFWIDFDRQVSPGSAGSDP
jgi:hypothetical protein